MLKKGKISTWEDSKGFGFISPADGGRRVFVHISAFNDRSRRPLPDDPVTYQLSRDSRGRTCAAAVVVTGATAVKARQTGRVRRDSGRPKPACAVSASLTALSFLLVVLILTFMNGLSLLIPCAYVFISGVTFLVYQFDKSAAEKGRWRTPESNLHLLGLAGGWPGALLAQQLLRHKSRKQSFQAAFWMTVFANSVGLIWYCFDGVQRFSM